MRYIVETSMEYGWENVWATEVNGVRIPETFATPEAAQAAIKEHIQDCESAVASGNMEDAPSVDDFRIQPLEAKAPEEQEVFDALVVMAQTFGSLTDHDYDHLHDVARSMAENPVNVPEDV